jgi:hypothetical protein
MSLRALLFVQNKLREKSLRFLTRLRRDSE